MKIIVIGNNHSWGRADDLKTALKNADRPKHYFAYECSDDTYVNEMGGLNRLMIDPEPKLLVKK